MMEPCPDPILCRRLGRHIHGHQYQLWLSDTPEAQAFRDLWEKEAAQKRERFLKQRKSGCGCCNKR